MNSTKAETKLDQLIINFDKWRLIPTTFPTSIVWTNCHSLPSKIKQPLGKENFWRRTLIPSLLTFWPTQMKMYFYVGQTSLVMQPEIGDQMQPSASLRKCLLDQALDLARQKRLNQHAINTYFVTTWHIWPLLQKIRLTKTSRTRLYHSKYMVSKGKWKKE